MSLIKDGVIYRTFQEQLKFLTEKEHEQETINEEQTATNASDDERLAVLEGRKLYNLTVKVTVRKTVTSTNEFTFNILHNNTTITEDEIKSIINGNNKNNLICCLRYTKQSNTSVISFIKNITGSGSTVDKETVNYLDSDGSSGSDVVNYPSGSFYHIGIQILNYSEVY